jgi:hypothetical protein
MMKERVGAAVVGFEGQLDETFHATWGTAAVRLRDKLTNPTTGFSADLDMLPSLVAEGALTDVGREIAIAERDATKPLILIAIRHESPFHDLLCVEKNRLGSIVVKSPRKETTFYVVRSREGLRQYSNDVADQVIARVFHQPESRDNLDLVRSALGLDSSHPELNAMKVFLAAGDRKHLIRLAQACIHGEEGQRAFQEMWNALNSQKKRHRLDYHKGITEGGGLDVDNAVSIFQSISKAVQKLASQIRLDYPFLPKVPSPRLFALSPGSARLEFASEATEQVGERVARYLELRALEKALKGEVPEELADDPAFEEALEKIIHPTPDTSLRQKPFEQDEPEAVDDPEPLGDDFTNEDFTLLGVITGALGDAEKLEVRIFPGARGRLLLSTSDDGNSSTPTGLGFLEHGPLPIYKLAVLHLTRRSDVVGRERFYLRRMQLLRLTELQTVDAVPSSVVRGAFRRIEHRTVALQHDAVLFGDTRLPPLYDERNSVGRWLATYRASCEQIELFDPRWEWIESVKRAISMTGRVLVSLSELGGELYANELAEEVTRRFERVMRVNNTRREVIQHSKLLKYTDDEKTIVGLTEYGQRYLDAYLAAGGERGSERTV